MNYNINLITKIEFWSNCAFIVIEGVGARFVSYSNLPPKLAGFISYFFSKCFPFEKQMMQNNAKDAYNEFLQVRAMAAVEDWALRCDRNGYTIAGVYITTYDSTVCEYIREKSAALPF